MVSIHGGKALLSSVVAIFWDYFVPFLACTGDSSCSLPLLEASFSEMQSIAGGDPELWVSFL